MSYFQEFSQEEASENFEAGRDAYSRGGGVDASGGADLDAVEARMKKAYEDIDDVFGADAESVLGALEEDPWSVFGWDDMTYEREAAVIEYINARSAVDGALSASAEAAEEKRAGVRRGVEDRTHRDRGVIIPAVMKIDDRPVYVVKGEVVMHADGSGVDEGSSSGSLVVMDARSGEYEFTSADRILRVEDGMDPEVELAEAYSRIDAQERAEASALSGRDDSGEVHGDDIADESQTADATEETPENPTKKGVSGEESVPNSAAPVENVEETAAPTTEPSALQRLPRDAKGEPVFEQAENPEHGWDALVEYCGGVEEDALAIARQMASDSVRKANSLRNGGPKEKKVSLAGKGSVTAMRAEQERVRKANEQAREEYELSLARAEESARAWSGIVGVYEARNVAALREAAALKAAEKEWYNETAAMKKRLGEVAEEVKDVPEALEVLGNMEPQTMDEVASVALRDHKVLWGDKIGAGGHRVSAGVGSHTGYGNGERKKLVGLFASAENGGVSVERLAEDTMEELCEYYGVGYDNGEALGALLDVISSSNTRGDITNYIARRRIGQALELHGAVKEREGAAKEEFCQVAYGMSGDEWDAYEEAEAEMLASCASGMDEELFYGAIADELKGEKDGDGIFSGSVGKGTGAGDVVGGVFLQSPRIDESGGTGETPASGAGGGAVVGGQGDGPSGGLSEDPREGRERGDGLRSGNFDRSVPSTPEAQRSAISRIMDFARKVRNRVERAVIGGITERQAKDFADNGIDVDETWVHSFESSAVGHNQKHHGDPGIEERAGQIAITEDDYMRIPEILESYDKVLKSPNRSHSTGNEVIIYEKEFEDGYVYYLEEKRDKRRSLSFQTMYKKKKGTDSSGGLMPVASPSTPIAPPDNLSSSSVGKDSASVSEKQVGGGESSAQTSDNKGEQTIQAAVEAASAQVNTSPTAAQAEAGNYRKGHVSIGDFDITIEHPAGSVRRGISKDKDGNETPWETVMQNAYGYIRGSESADGDHIDVFLHTDMDEWNGRKVYVVDQTNTDGSFDEHKVMLGFNDKDEAMAAYLANYDETWADSHPGLRISETNIEDFNKWVQSSRRKTKAFAEYKSVKPIRYDSQGNPIDENGNLIIEDVKSVSDITDADFTEPYTITPAVYVGKSRGNQPGKETPMHRVRFNRQLSEEQERAVKAFANETIGEKKGRYAVKRGWADREAADGSWLFRTEEDARKAGEMIGEEEAVADARPMTAGELRDAVAPAEKKPVRKPKKAPVNRVSLEDVMSDLSTKGETRLSDHAEEVKAEPEAQYEISDEEMRTLADELRDLLGIGDDEGETDIKFRDPGELTPQERQRIQSAGIRLAMGLIERGTTAFPDYAARMVGLLGDKIRPWLKSFYEGARWTPGYDKYTFTPSEEVATFDVQNFDKREADPIAQAAMIVEERKAGAASAQAQKELIETRNRNRRENDRQTESDTVALAEKGEAVAGKAESLAETSEDTAELNRAAEEIDDSIEEINDQLALLGYYEYAEDDASFHESYGYMLTAEKKAVADATRLARQLVNDLGIDLKVTGATTPLGRKSVRKGTAVRANLAPAGGDVIITLPLKEGRELVIYIGLEPVADRDTRRRGDNLAVGRIMYRVENPDKVGADRYETINHHARRDVSYDELYSDIRRIVRHYLPEERVVPATPLTRREGEGIVDMARRVVSDNKAAAPGVEPRQTMASLFGDEIENFDNQGNPIDGKGRYIVEEVKTVTELSDADFMNPTRNVALPSLPARVSDAIGADGRRPMIKKNIFGKNRDSHKDLTADDGRMILKEVLYNPDLYGQNQKVSRPYNWIMVHLSAKNSAVVLEVNPTKDYLEIVNWHYLKGRQLEQKKRQAEREGGRILTLQESNVAGDASQGLSSVGKGNEKSLNRKTNERTEIQPGAEGAGGGGGQPRRDEPLGAGTGDEAERTDGGGMAGRGGEHTVSDTGRGAGVSGEYQGGRGVSAGRTPEEARTPTAPRNRRNNHAERGTEYAPKGEKARIEANIAAVELSKKLLATGAAATPQEMAVLRRYSGWGGLGSAFNEGKAWSPNPVNRRLREVLGAEEYESAVMSRNSAYYTPAAVIDAMWDIARGLGFKGGDILEGSAGIGNIIGQMPADMSERSNIHAVEIDPTSGGILSLLYPDAQVEIQGFEQTRIESGSVDLAITNVPFVTDLHVKDETGDGDLSRKFRDIHDFCIAKNVRKLREGGIGIFITSSGTLDKSQKLRNWLVGDKEGNADVVGVFRMNNQTFGGTGATSDIIVVRKRVDGRRSVGAIDVSTVTPVRTATFTDARGKSKEIPLYVNRYFTEHPEYMGGEMFLGFEQGDTYRPTSAGLFPTRTADQGARMAAWVRHLADMDWSKEQGKAAIEQTSHINEALGDGVKEGSMVTDSEGNLCVARMGRAVPLTLNKNKIKGRTKQECFKDYTEIKTALSDVLKYQTEHEDDAGLQPLLERLNRAYDTFVERYGNLNRNNSLAWLRNDVDFSGIVALETYSEKGNKAGTKEKTYGKTDIFRRRVVEKEREPSPKNVKDGIIASIYKYGRIDTGYLATQLGKGREEVRKEIVDSGLGFADPVTGEMEVSYEYLSGNVREKLRQAREANERSGGVYETNIKVLERVVPMNIPAHLIEFALGSSWIEPELYERYIKERTELDVRLTNAGGTWHMSEPRNTDRPRNTEMGVRSESFGILIPGHKLIEAALTNKTISVSMTVSA